MTEKGQTNSEELKIQGLLDRYLRFRASSADAGAHLDEDALAAFTEGRLSPPESSLVIGHLLECSFCLHVSAELFKLEAALSEETPAPFAVAAAQPTKISDVLNNLLEKIFSGGDAVFAHQEDENKPEDDNGEPEENKKDD